MPRKLDSNNKKTKTLTKTQTTYKNTNINNVFMWIKPKQRKRRTTKPKENSNPRSNTIGESRPVSAFSYQFGVPVEIQLHYNYYGNYN